MDKDAILEELRRVAAETGGRPFGRKTFERATGISPYEWGRYWAKFGDALHEAGFEPNTLNAAFPEAVLLEALASVVRELGRIPSVAELRITRTQDPTFPSAKVFARLGGKNERVGRLLAFCTENGRYPDVAAICEAVYVPEPLRDGVSENQARPIESKYGFVYLVRGHPGEYKVGRTNLVDRRMSELGATASIEQELIHIIKTDDPSGVEAYWHNRFAKAGKKMRGEWFRLQASDIAAFRRWRRIA